MIRFNLTIIYDDGGGGGGGGDRIRWCDTLLTRESSVRVIQIATTTHQHTRDKKKLTTKRKELTVSLLLNLIHTYLHIKEGINKYSSINSLGVDFIGTERNHPTLITYFRYRSSLRSSVPPTTAAQPQVALSDVDDLLLRFMRYYLC